MLKFFPATLLAVACALTPISAFAQQPEPLASQVVDGYAEHIFYNSGAAAMALVAIDNNQQVFRSFGETRPGNDIRPRKDSLIRIASLTKLMTSEVLVKLADERKVSLYDPLRKYAPKGMRVPSYSANQPIVLMNLASHTSGLPREQPGGVPHRDVFTWPTKSDRWQWLKSAKITVPPGVRASYSNLAFDLLADALAQATGKSYPSLLKEKVTQPLGMKDTTYTPSPEQCSRMIVPARGASPCQNSLAAIGSGGIYSTPEDMQRWMQQFLSSATQPRSPYAQQLLKMYYQREKLTMIKGMDVSGKAAALGLGWVYIAPQNGLPGIIQKTGGGGGFITYMALIPEKNVGVFVVVARTELSKFTNMSDGVNQLVSELAQKNQ